MANVYEAEQIQLGRRVALKVLHDAGAFAPDARARFEREAEAAARLDHPNIVRIIDRGSADGRDFIAMELVRGKPLDRELEDRRRLMRAGELRFDRKHIEWAADTVIEVLRALAFAHERGVVHRDVKPGNILIGEDGRARVADFGLARIDRGKSITMPGQVMGTPEYMSPEMAQPGQRPVDHRTDVFSCGVLLYELLSLEKPFTGQDSNAVIQSIIHRSPPPLRGTNPHLPRDLETIVMKAVEKLPDDRYSTASAFADDIERFVNYAEILARPAGAPTKAIRLVRRRPAATIAVALAILIVLVGSWRLVRGLRIDGHLAAAERAWLKGSYSEAREAAIAVLRIDPNHARAAEILRLASGLPTERLRVIGGPALVYVVPYDHRSGLFGERRDLFEVDGAEEVVKSVEIEEGQYRLVAQSPLEEDRFADRWLLAGTDGDERTLTLKLMSFDEIRVSLLPVAAGKYTIGSASLEQTAPERKLEIPEFRVAAHPIKWEEIPEAIAIRFAARIAKDPPGAWAGALNWFEGDDILAEFGLRHGTEYEIEASCRGLAGDGSNATLRPEHERDFGVWTASSLLAYAAAEKSDSVVPPWIRPFDFVIRGLPPQVFTRNPNTPHASYHRTSNYPWAITSGIRGVRSVRPPR